MSKTVSCITRNFQKYDPNSIDEYLNIGGFDAVKKALKMSSEDIISEVKASGIRGRGGAAYDTGKKWGQAAEVPGENKVVICNADEGEPCTFKDRSLLEFDPYAIIEGMMIAGMAVGAANGYVYIREEYRHLNKLMKKCIEQAESKGLLGDNILDSGFNYRLHVYSGAGAYVCGEGSTLIESIEGKSGRPRIKPPYIKQCGLFNLPTLVNNVETLAIVPYLITEGAKEFTKHGTPDSPGTKIVSVAGNVNNPGSYEIPFGLTLREIIEDVAGGMKDGREFKFFQLGGASGKIAPASVADTPFTYDELHKVDLVVGSGAILVADDRMKVLDFVKCIQDFFLHESCGKCTPCREGNRQLTKIIDKFVAGTQSETDFETLDRFANIMKNCSFCGLGETAPSALLNAIKYFPADFGLEKE